MLSFVSRARVGLGVLALSTLAVASTIGAPQGASGSDFWYPTNLEAEVLAATQPRFDVTDSTAPTFESLFTSENPGMMVNKLVSSARPASPSELSIEPISPLPLTPDAGDPTGPQPITPEPIIFPRAPEDGGEGTEAPDYSSAIVSCEGSQLPRSDDGSSAPIPVPFPINFLGTTTETIYVNQNGTISFDAPLEEFSPSELSNLGVSVIAPFLADVDTRSPESGLVRYGTTTFEGRPAFCATWDQVGYYNQAAEKTNTFQALVVQDLESGEGHIDVVFNYGSIGWESGDANGGKLGVGGSPARIGLSDRSGGAPGSFEFTYQGEAGRFTDGGALALQRASRGANSIDGRLVFDLAGDSEVQTGGGTEDTTIRIVALGDEYAAGVGYDQELTSGPCRQGSHSYVDVLAATAQTQGDLTVEVTNRGCAGRTIDEVIAHDLPNSDTDAVTVQVGRNEARLGAFTAYCSLADDCGEIGGEQRGRLGDPMVTNVDNTYNQLVALYRAVQREAPQASVFVLGYPLLFPSNGDNTCPAMAGISVEEAQYLNGLTERLNQTIERAATASGVHYVPFSGDGQVSSPCDNPALTNGAGATHPVAGYTPTAAGYRHYADQLLVAKIWDLPLNPRPGVSIGVAARATRGFEARVAATIRCERSTACELVVDEIPVLTTSATWRAVLYPDSQVLQEGVINNGEKITVELPHDPTMSGGGHSVVVVIESPEWQILHIQRFELPAPCQPVVVEFSQPEIQSRLGRNTSSVEPVQFDCQRYQVQLGSGDFRHRVGYQSNQIYEQWFLEGLDAEGSVIYQSAVTPDLPESQTVAVSEMGVAELAKVVAVRAQHAMPGEEGYHSVQVTARFVPVS